MAKYHAGGVDDGSPTGAVQHTKAGIDVNRPFASVQCCIDDITLVEFISFQGRMGTVNSNGATLDEYVPDAITKDGDAMVVPYVLAQDVGVVDVFSDWPAVVTYYIVLVVVFADGKDL